MSKSLIMKEKIDSKSERPSISQKVTWFHLINKTHFERCKQIMNQSTAAVPHLLLVDPLSLSHTDLRYRTRVKKGANISDKVFYCIKVNEHCQIYFRI